MLILLVEDNRTTGESLRMQFENSGWNVRLVPDGADALVLLNSGVIPYILLTDIVMPRMGGEELIQEIRRHREWDRVKIAAITATEGPAFEEMAERLAKNGVILLAKPFTTEQLGLAIQGLIDKGKQK